MTVASDRARARRLRRPPGKHKSGPSGKRPSLFDVGEFVAVDGEGFSEGEPFEITIGKSGNVYRARSHYYAYLAASDGSEAQSSTGRLGLAECLTFLCVIAERNPRAIFVAFGASYDVTQMVAHDLTPAEVATMLGKNPLQRRAWFEADGYVYGLEYRPRKCLSIQRWRVGERRWTLDAKGRRKATPHLTVRLWDVWGFFQGNFVQAMEKWLPGDPDHEFIRRMKGDRRHFARDEIAEIRRYNAAELRCLVKIMEKVRAGVRDLGLKLTRWDGAGAVAAAMLAKHDVKSRRGTSSAEVFEAARRAYSGGHIEACQLGYHPGTVHHYDVNSAYPAEFVNLPGLDDGRWFDGVGEPPEGFTVAEVQWEFADGAPFYPLFWRDRDGSILYPRAGRGWYWSPELKAASRFAKAIGGSFDVIRWHHFRTSEANRPFGWVRDYYQQRRELLRTGVRGGPDNIIRLGTNSLYGKTAQQVGAREDGEGFLRLPPYFQLEWAGYVTAGCRAKLIEAALQNPDAIIAFATDGLFSTAPLDLWTPPEKELGAWEYQRHDGMTLVMPGVYWLHDPPSPQEASEGKAGPIRHYSRGFDKREMTDPEFVHAAWRERRSAAPIAVERLIGLGTAAASDDFWRMRGCFVTSERRLALDGDNSKRYPLQLERRAYRPWERLERTRPRDHDLANLFGWEPPASAPYPIAWIDDGTEQPDIDPLEGERIEDAEALDAELA